MEIIAYYKRPGSESYQLISRDPRGFYSLSTVQSVLQGWGALEDFSEATKCGCLEELKEIFEAVSASGLHEKRTQFLSEVSTWLVDHRNPRSRDHYEDVHWTLQDLKRMVEESSSPDTLRLAAQIFNRFKHLYR
jgi:hypothetical protein